MAAIMQFVDEAQDVSGEPSASVITELNVFLSAVEAVTHKPTVLYIGREFQDRYQVREALQRPPVGAALHTSARRSWTIWQVDGFAHVDGIERRVDLDFVR